MMLEIGKLFSRQLVFRIVVAATTVFCGHVSLAVAVDGMSPVSPAFLRWQKTHRLNRTLKPAVTISKNKARSRLASPGQAEQMDETGLVPTVFNAAYLGNINRYRVRGVDSAFPAKYDLRNEGWASPVKNQSPYGTCWAHATCASLESALMKSSGMTLDFSENNLANLHGGDWDFDTGGNGDLSSAYLLRWSGPVLESSDPYPNIGGSSAMPAFRHVQNVRWILPKKVYLDNDGIKEALMKNGALYVSYFHDAGWYNAATASYYFNIVQKEEDGSRANNHAVAIVGWDDGYSRNNFKIKPSADGAYLVKNSMGSAWGVDGYFYVSYFDESFAWNRMYAFSNAEPVSNYDAIYQYDTLGLVNSVGWGEMPTWGACMFTATNTSPISAVGFYALVPETSYTIQIYTGCRSGNPTSGAKALEQIGQTDCAGYVTVPLQNAVGISRGQTFSVVLKLTTSGYGAPLACEYAVPGYSSAATAASGQTFASLDGESWRDFTKLNGTASFCCKAYTRPVSAQSKTLTALVIDGVVSVRSGKTAQFTCWARYSDGTATDVTESARWSIIEGGEYASVSDGGVVSAREIRDRQEVRLYAEYIEGGVMQSDVWPFNVTYAAPLSPNGLSATQGSETTCVRLYWNATEDTSSYAVYRGETDQSENAEYLSEANANVFDDTKAVPGVMYHYFVKAKNSSGSSPFSAGAMGWRALSAPENVVAGNGTSLDYVEVTWCESPGASYYQVYRAEDLDDEPEAISGWQTALSFRDRDVVAGKTYLYYVVSAVDALGEMASGFSLFDDGWRAVPVFPKSLEIVGEASIASGDSSTYICKVTYTDGSIKLTQPSAWLITVGGAYAKILPSGMGIVSTEPVAANQTIVLQADYVEKDKQLTDFKTITVRASKPSAPLAVSTTSVSEQGITVSWSVNTASSPALAYKIYRMAAGGDLILLATIGSDATAYRDMTATPGVTYTYRVAAVNGAGDGPISAASATETVPLAAPSSVAASDGEYFDKVSISWKPVTGATHYKVFRARSQSSADATAICDWQTGVSYEDALSEPGLSYWYFVRAASDNQGGNAGGFGSGDNGWCRAMPVLDSISISGAPKLAAGGAAVYSCVATYADGDRQPVKPQWTVNGPATMDESERLLVNSVSASSTVTLTARYSEGSVERSATKTVAIVVPVKATADVKNVTVAPRWPFNGTVDIDYEVETSPDGTLASVSVSGYDYDHRLALAALAVEGDGSTGAVHPGRHRLSWNVAADHPHLHVRSFGVEMSAVPIPVLIPTNVIASTGTSSEAVNLSWSAVDEALRYEVYRSATDFTNDAVRVAETYNLNYSDTNAVSGTQYHYWIRSVSAEGLSDFGESVLGWRAYPDIGVIFDGNGGTAPVWSEKYEPLKVYGVLPIASRKGYSFEGWYTSPDGGDEITVASIVPISQITLYARWKATTYAVRFNANGGKGQMGDLSMTYDVSVELPPCAFSRDGYNFAGWAESSDGSVKYIDGVSVKNLTDVNGVTVELFAVWKPIAPEAPKNITATKRETTDGIVVSWQGVSGVTEYRVYRAEMDSAANSELVGSTPNTSWLDSTCDVGKTYYFWVKAYRSDNSQESGFSAPAWGRRRYPKIVCTFNGNGGTATSSAKQYTPEFAYDDLPSATRTGYTLADWYTEPINGDKVSISTIVPISDHILYAHWSPNSYAVHFDANGGSGTMHDQPMTYDREAALSENRFTRGAYTFGGWSRSANGSIDFADKAPVRNLVSDNGGSITLFALWNPILPAAPQNVRAASRESTEGIAVTWSAVENATAYYIFRDEDANCPNPQQIGTATGTSYLDKVCVAGKTYYYWIKAFRADNGSVSASLSSPAADGRRRYSNVTVSFNGNGGTPGAPSKSATPEFAYGDLPSATRTGYTFVGWYTAASGGALVQDSSIVPVNDTTVYAHWAANAYTVRFNANSGTGTMADLSMTYDEEKSLTANTFTWTYHTFAGWATNASGTAVHADKAKVKNLASVAGSVVMLYAVWSPVVPSAPTTVAASMGASTNEISITWSSVANATAYEIWRGESNVFASAKKIGTATSTSYTDNTAEAGKLYYYWIKPSNPAAAGGVSASPAQGALKLMAPQGVTATSATYTDKVVVAWSAVSGAVRYDIYRVDVDDVSKVVQIGQTSELTFTDTNVNSGERHYYWIKAQCSVAESASDFSEPVVGYAQKALVSLSIEGAVELDAGSESVYKAKAFYSDESSEYVQPVWTIKEGAAYAQINSTGKLTVNPSQVDQAVVIHASFANNGQAMAEKTVSIHKVIPLEVALDSENLTFTTDGDASWYWTEDAAFVGGYAVRSGVIVDGKSSSLQTTVDGPCTVSFIWKVSSETGDILSFAVDGVAKNQISGTASAIFVEQAYTIESHGNHTLTWTYVKNASGSSGLDCGWVDNVQYARIYAPSAPTGVSATSDSTAGVTVSWTASAAATSYEVWRGTSSDVSQATKLGTATTASYSDTSASPGVAYTYWIVAVNMDGPSEKSAPATGVRKLTAPTGLSSSASTSGAKISWTAVAGATGYVVYRSTSTDSSTREQLATTPNTQWQDSGGYPGRNYYYWIVATCSTCQSNLSDAILSYKKLVQPSYFNVSRNNNVFTFAFGSVTEAVEYEIYYPDKGWHLYTGGKTSYTWTWQVAYYQYFEVYPIGENGQRGEGRSAKSN